MRDESGGEDTDGEQGGVHRRLNPEG
jgi:hypothetical protein